MQGSSLTQAKRLELPLLVYTHPARPAGHGCGRHRHPPQKQQEYVKEIGILRAMLNEEGLEMAVFKSDYVGYYHQLMTAPCDVQASRSCQRLRCQEMGITPSIKVTAW
eukprot:COSAG04_NODE_1732_length_5768_cov_11.998236_7_plen_108_part_00